MAPKRPERFRTTFAEAFKHCLGAALHGGGRQSGEDIDATVCTTWPEGRRPIESSIAVSGCARDRLPGIDQHGETGLAGPMAARGRAVHRILEHL
jgi:hypothetical protein